MRTILAVILGITISLPGFTADKQPSYKLAHDGSSLPPVKSKAFDAENILGKLQIDIDVIKHDFVETAKLMDVFENDKENLVAAANLNNAIDNVMERMAYEGWLLELYNHITTDQARESAEKLMHQHYANLAMMTAFSVKAASIVARDSKSKDLGALATKVEADIQKIAERYQVLSKE